MIKTIAIANFKSIKSASLECSRVNVFIGEPNTGKSNILETIGMFSFSAYSQRGNANQFVRFERTSNLFYDEEVSEPLSIKIDDFVLTIRFERGAFLGNLVRPDEAYCDFRGSNNSLSRVSGRGLNQFKFYRFRELDSFPSPESDFLLPPSGENLLSFLRTHGKMRKLVNQLLSPSGLSLGLRPSEHKVELVKKVEDVIYSYPYKTVSDTFRRLIFYLTAIEGNKSSILAFEEPAAHAFPHYIKYLAEKIASDISGNQYFITTHNPYFLLTLVSKTFPEEINVFVTDFQKYQTQLKPLSRRKIEAIMSMDVDVFFELDKLMGRK